MPNGPSERSALIEHCGVGGSVRKGTLYPIEDYGVNVTLFCLRLIRQSGATY